MGGGMSRWVEVSKSRGGGACTGGWSVVQVGGG